MCRIAYLADAKAWKEDVLAYLFASLEKSMGGSGNGLALFKKDGTVRVVKGLEQKTDALAKVAAGKPYPILFHTRAASIGPVCDELCQPFVAGGTTLCHNGHWSDYKTVGAIMIAKETMPPVSGPISDSMIATYAAEAFGLDFLKFASGVFIAHKDGETYAYVNSGSFTFAEFKQGIIYASEIPEDWRKISQVYSFDSGSVAKLTAEGPKMVEGAYSKYHVSKSTVYYSGGHNWGYGTPHQSGWWDENSNWHRVDPSSSAVKVITGEDPVIDANIKEIEEASRTSSKLTSSLKSGEIPQQALEEMPHEYATTEEWAEWEAKWGGL